MAKMAEKEYKVYLKEVNWWSTTVTAACEEDAKDRAEEEHEYRGCLLYTSPSPRD